VQANIDPQHRDRVAFVRLASGRFQRGMKLKNIRTGRQMSVQAPVFFLARERNLAEEAWPGDIIGIPTTGASGSAMHCVPKGSRAEGGL
jgi:peptide chain release factor 3